MSLQRILRSLRPSREGLDEITLEDEVALYRRRAGVALREERYNDALVFLAKILRLNPYDLSARMVVAETYHLHLEEPTKALLTYEKVIAAAGYDDSNPFCSSAREGIRQLSGFVVAPVIELQNLEDGESCLEESGGLPRTAAL